MADTADKPDIQSNLGHALQQWGVKGVEGADKLGNVIGAIADIAGAVSGIIGFVDFVISIFNSGPDELQQILTAIQELFQQLEENQQAEDLIAKLTSVQDDYSSIMTAGQSIKSLSAQLPLAPSFVTTQLQNILTSLNKLCPPDIMSRNCPNAGTGGPWLVPYNLQLFWSDTDSPDVVWPPAGVPPPFGFLGKWQYIYGYGEQAPTAGIENTVFNFTYILPQYLQAITVFLSIGALIDPKFVQNWGQSVIKPTACLLLSVHDYIVNNGLTQLSPGYWDGPTLGGWLFISSLPGSYVSRPAVGPVVPSSKAGVFPVVNNPQTDWNLAGLPELKGDGVGVNIEYGAVEKFSGNNYVSIYQLLCPPYSLASTDAAPYNKFSVRLLQKTKKLYNAVGLNTVWNIVNNLNRLVGDPPLSGPNFGDWSFREIAAKLLAPAPEAPPPPNLPISLLSLKHILMNTPPADTPWPPNSFEQPGFRFLLGSTNPSA